MSEVATKSRTKLIIDLLFHALRVKDRVMNEHAAEVFRRTGPELARRLILEAARKKNSPAHRLRMLAVTWLARRLMAAGYRPWCRSLSLLAGERAAELMEGIIRNHSCRVVAIYSSDSLQSLDAQTRRSISDPRIVDHARLRGEDSRSSRLISVG